MSKKALRDLGLGGSAKGKTFGFLLLAVVVGCVITAPLESAHFVNTVFHAFKTFFSSF